MISQVRGFIKSKLKNTGPLYNVAKRAYQFYKRHADSKRVARAHPSADIVHFDAAALSEIRAKGYTSQFGQDSYLLETVFAGRTEGRFAEIGANHPIENNNSYALERAGWTGWSFDPLTRFKQDWIETRKTPLICCALSGEAGQRAFVEFKDKVGWEHQLSGFQDSIRPEDMEVHEYSVYDVECNSLIGLLPDVEHLDLAMIDVEGAELFVIEGLGLDKIRIDWLLIENVSELGGDERVRQVLDKHSYVLRARIAATDDLYERVA